MVLVCGKCWCVVVCYGVVVSCWGVGFVLLVLDCWAVGVVLSLLVLWCWYWCEVATHQFSLAQQSPSKSFLQSKRIRSPLDSPCICRSRSMCWNLWTNRFCAMVVPGASVFRRIFWSEMRQRPERWHWSELDVHPPSYQIYIVTNDRSEHYCSLIIRCVHWFREEHERGFVFSAPVPSYIAVCMMLEPLNHMRQQITSQIVM